MKITDPIIIDWWSMEIDILELKKFIDSAIENDYKSIEFQVKESYGSHEIEMMPNKNELCKLIEMPFDSEEFKELWIKWKTYRRQQHKFRYNSHITEQMALNGLSMRSGYDEEISIQIIKKSMSMGWKGFFDGEISKNDNIVIKMKEGKFSYE